RFGRAGLDMDESTDVLRLRLEGRWYAEDLAACMGSVATLYDLRIVLQAFRDGVARPDKRSPRDRRRSDAPLTEGARRSGQDRRRQESTSASGSTPYLAPSLLVDQDQLGHLSRLLCPRARLEILRIHYGSPGSCDLAGLGTVVSHLKEFLAHVVEQSSSARASDSSNERAELERRLMRSDYARQFVDVAGELGYGAEEWQDIVGLVEPRQGAIIDLVEKQKLTAVTAA